MGNLGWYQLLTTWAKKVGGPKNLIALFLGSGVVAGGGAVAGGSWVKRKVSTKLEEKKQAEKSAIIYTINKEGRSNEGLQFRIGDQFKVLEVDGDAGLIEKLGDNNNPYFVSLKFLKSISNYE